MESLLNLLMELESDSNTSLKKKIEHFFFDMFGEMVDEIGSEFNRQKDQIAYKISVLLNSELHKEIIIDEIKKRFSYSRLRNDYDEVIVYSLVSAETNAANLILKDILKSESDILKAYI